MSPVPPAKLCCWELRGRPVMAYAEGSAENHRCAVDLFPCTTFKRSLLARAVRLAVFWRIEWRFCSLRESAGSILRAADLVSLLASVKEAGDGAEMDWLLTWPAQPERQRVYLIFRPRTGGSLGVVKIGAGEFNGRQLRNEAVALKQLAASSHPFSVPSLLFERELPEGRVALATGGFPSHRQSVSSTQATGFGHEVIEHLRRISVPVSQMRPGDCDWMPAFRDQAPSCVQTRHVLDAADTRIEVGFAHGDLGPGNMLKEGKGGIFLFDWENASMQAPIRTDAVGLWLACRQRHVLRSPSDMARALRAQWASVPEQEILFALAFLCAHGNLAATQILEGWK